MLRRRIIIADDHVAVRLGVRQVFANCPDFDVVDEAVDGRELLARLRVKEVDVVVTDMAMPGISGIDLIKRVKAEAPQAMVVVHSMYADGQMASRALKAGASGYVSKGSDADMLVAAVRKAVSGQRFVSPDMVDSVLGAFESGGDGLPHENLSDREFQVFQLLISGKGITEIGTALSLSPKTASTHKTRIMHKLGLNNVAALVEYGIRHNLKP